MSSPTTNEQIRVRAYELWEARGRTEGKSVEDWLAAEEQLRGAQQAASVATTAVDTVLDEAEAAHLGLPPEPPQVRIGARST